jgi:hypothetical protein
VEHDLPVPGRPELWLALGSVAVDSAQIVSTNPIQPRKRDRYQRVVDLTLDKGRERSSALLAMVLSRATVPRWVLVATGASPVYVT